ncbi:MAG: efflux RND transporter periplasmic adaptor subunit, partial [Lachnospiraceae bacterium]|nr:efflux RND transporter periplasmic adaptor subunit [Lachnospiraceae bacterium]
TAYTNRQRAVESAQDAVEDYQRAVEAQQDASTNANASLQTAEANRQVTDTRVLEDTKRVLDAQIQSSTVGVEQAQYALDQYVSKAPISGVVESVNIDPHDTVSPSVAAMVITNKDTMKITFSVPEGVRDNLAVGQKLKVKKDDLKCKGRITQVGEVLDANTGLFEIEAAVSGEKGLLNGTTVTVKVDSYRDNSGIVIPYDAVYYSNGEPYVYVVEGSTAKRRDVKTGMFDKKRIVIASGVKAGEQVITSWSADLRDGAEIEVVDQDSPQEAEENESPDAADGDGASESRDAADGDGASESQEDEADEAENGKAGD